MSDLIITPPTKRCTKCGNEFPATTEFFPAKSSGKYGVAARCKPCFREDSCRYSAEWRERNPEKVQESSRRECKIHAEERRERTRIYREKYPDRVKETQRRSRQKHRERDYATRRAWYARNKEHAAEWRRNNRAKNHERILEVQREAGARWRAANPDKIREFRHRRRSAPGRFTTEDLAAVRAAQTDKKGRLICCLCHKPIEDTPHLDHWIPLAEGGTHDPGNLRYMHAYCNQSKGGKHPTELGRLI